MLRPETVKIQHDLAMYCRSGEEVVIPGLTEGRLPHYRRLVYNVVNGAIAQAYPVTRKILTDDEWKYMFNSFFVEHDSQTPILWRLPYEFYLYVKQYKYDEQYHKPWLVELLWFEWLEIEVHMMPDEEHPPFHKKGDVLKDHAIVNRDSQLIQLEYPIHLYPVEDAVLKKGNYYVFIYREMDSGTVRFVNLSVLHAWLFNRLLNAKREPVMGLMPEIAGLLNLKDDKNLKVRIEKFMEKMLDTGAILGFSK